MCGTSLRICLCYLFEPPLVETLATGLSGLRLWDGVNFLLGSFFKFFFRPYDTLQNLVCGERSCSVRAN